MALVALRRALETPRLLRLQLSQTHQTGDAVLAAGYSLVLELVVDTRTTVDTVVVIVHGLDLVVQFLVGHLPRAGWPFAPSVIAAR